MSPPDNARRANDESVVVEVISATRFLSASLIRPGLGVWDALEESIRWWTAAQVATEPDGVRLVDVPWDDPDPLRSALEHLLTSQPSVGAVDGHTVADIITAALTDWLTVMAQRHTDEHRFTFLLTDESWPWPVDHEPVVGAVNGGS